MRDLSFGFCGEGAAEYEFLMPVIERILQELLPQSYIRAFDFSSKTEENDSEQQIERMIRVAQQADGLDILIFHLDADAPDTSRAYQQRFRPGYDEVQRIANHVNKEVIPIIPVRMTEAWLLVDFPAFCDVIGTKEKAGVLGFPKHPDQVESIQDPKMTFRTAIDQAVRRRKNRKRIPEDEVFRPLAQKIDLGLLEQVPAYREFLEKLKGTLNRLHFLEDE